MKKVGKVLAVVLAVSALGAFAGCKQQLLASATWVSIAMSLSFFINSSAAFLTLLYKFLLVSFLELSLDYHHHAGSQFVIVFF